MWNEKRVTYGKKLILKRLVCEEPAASASDDVRILVNGEPVGGAGGGDRPDDYRILWRQRSSKSLLYDQRLRNSRESQNAYRNQRQFWNHSSGRKYVMTKWCVIPDINGGPDLEYPLDTYAKAIMGGCYE